MKTSSLLAKLPFGPWRTRHPAVSVVRLAGVIGASGPLRQSLNLTAVAPLLERAFAPKRLAAVALIINSPGGSPVQSALIARRIRDLAEEKKVPVLAFCEDVAASGGYWLACAADEIYADANSIVGSIGVVSGGFGFQDLIARFGIERRLYTAGEKKVLLDPFQPEKPDAVERLRAIQREMHESFKELVRERRGARLTGDDGELFSGAFWTGASGLGLGLIDGIDHARPHLRRRFGEKVQLRVIHGEKRLFRRLGFGVSAAGGAFATALPDAAIAAAEERALWARYGL
ncbi:S49 family peptidase [Azospirillum sp. RWY-5-1]|uniref:S49 family peptidase n=1 Tax=Azospirillum oleiclasticum TaxID=2735135 RepID=A0ABX2TJE2_9PROT|nr:S49 family peptidase [Azospirillum oleiclasticum]NYZ16799.1 S49 family peptidase [Azospirillum oleiclasticum]NYZ24467.1 S49 family peptidase [Azospirillum oleiclasticum]